MTVTTAQKRKVRDRAGGCCEYCWIPESVDLIKFHIDHIIPIKHGGEDTDENLCLACSDCNSYKGPNVAALDPLTQDAAKLYNPRQQAWDTHFNINPDAIITGLTPEGRTTVFVMRMNDRECIKDRAGLRKLGKYPCKKED